MNRRTLLLTVTMLIAAIFQSVKADKKGEAYQNSYNYKRGEDLFLNEKKEAEALEFFNKELEEHKDNGYAYFWVAIINESNKQYGKAFDAANSAIKYLNKDAHWQSYAYRTRARVYLVLGEDDKALADMNEAVKLDPKESVPYQSRGEFYLNKKQFELASADFKKMIELAPGEAYGYLALGGIAFAQERYDDAIEQYNYAIKLVPDEALPYDFRAQAEIHQRKYAEAIDDVIQAFNIDKTNDMAYDLIKALSDSANSLTNIKLKAQQKHNPNDIFWPYLIGLNYANSALYLEAIPYFQKAFDNEPNDVFANRLADCYEEIGDYPMALMYINRALEMDSLYDQYQLHRVEIEEFAGKIDDALRDINTYIDNFPDDYYGYYKRAWLKDKNGGKIDEAIEDYTTSVTLEPTYAYNYLCRGQLYKIKGKADLAKADFEEVLRLDTLASESNARQYALFYLGDTIKAVEWMNKILEEQESDELKGNCYDAACLYSLIGDLDKSLEYFKKCLDLGWDRFSHARKDDDLTNLRTLPVFEELLKDQEKKLQAKFKEDSDNVVAFEEKEAEIPFAKESGICKVKCTINQLPLYFVFDTGASNVSISNVEANFMLKNDYLSKSDMTGKGYFIDANGDISEGTLVTLKEVNFGGLTLKNVKASVVKNQKAPLLLGQSVLSRLGKIEIDNDNRIIRVKYQEKK